MVKDKPINFKNRCGKLMVILLKQINILKNLNCDNINCLEWQNCLRYYFDFDKNTIIIRYGDY